LNPWTWAPKASTLLLDHRSHITIRLLTEIRCGWWTDFHLNFERNATIHRMTVRIS
jgi:hypothetical protein